MHDQMIERINDHNEKVKTTICICVLWVSVVPRQKHPEAWLQTLTNNYMTICVCVIWVLWVPVLPMVVPRQKHPEALLRTLLSMAIVLVLYQHVVIHHHHQVRVSIGEAVRLR